MLNDAYKISARKYKNCWSWDKKTFQVKLLYVVWVLSSACVTFITFKLLKIKAAQRVGNGSSGRNRLVYNHKGNDY